MMKLFKRFQDLGIEGGKANYYNRMTRGHRIGEMKEQAKEAASHVKDGDSILEIAPGAGYLSIESSKLGNYKLTDVDISNDFVEIARRNAEEAGVAVDFRQGNVSNTPFADWMFDFIICTAAFKNIRDSGKALFEMHRIWRPGGAAQIVDMKQDVSDYDLDSLTNDMNVKGAKPFS